jgi:opacity protein-like surface antigen
MKKITLCAVLVLCTAAAALALPPLKLSVGGGGLFASDFGGGVKQDSSGEAIKMPWYGGGGFAFFDATYAELAVSFIYGAGKYDEPNKAIVNFSIMNLGFSLLGKYPFSIGKLSVFPLVGVEYRRTLSVKDEDGNEVDTAAGDFSALWFQAGGGADFALTNNLFIRGSLLYGLRLPSTFEDDKAKDFGPGVSPRLGHGLTVKIAVGYRF